MKRPPSIPFPAIGRKPTAATSFARPPRQPSVPPKPGARGPFTMLKVEDPKKPEDQEQVHRDPDTITPNDADAGEAEYEEEEELDDESEDAVEDEDE